jgi:hypothetical protein
MSKSAIPSPREFAQLLLAYEVTLGKPLGTKGVVAFRVVEKLRAPLGKLMGTGGFQSLLSRALTLANAEVAWLCKLHIKADGSWEGIDELQVKLNAHMIANGEVAIVSQLLGLLVTFIGPALTLQLLQDIWPKMDALTYEK